MASALQCPACGYKHRLSALSGDPVFSCVQCGRLLKTPAEYLRPEPSGPSAPPRPSSNARVQRGGSAARDQTSVIPAAGTARAPGPTRPAPPGSRRPGPRPQAPVALPLRILAWIAAIVLGAYIVRWFARAVGWLTGDSLIDVITGSGIGRYLRVFALVPFWALAATLLATLLIEGGRWFARRRSLSPGHPARPPARRVPVAKQPAQPKQPKQPKPQSPRPRQPAPRPATQNPVAQEPRAPSPSPAAAETRAPSGAAGAPRPRRIPRRDVSP